LNQIILNFLINQLIGGLLIGLGAWSFSEEYQETDISKFQNVVDVFVHVSLGLIIVGTIVFIMSCAGCLGALRENLCFLNLVSYNQDN